jgi:hypothetical protein
LGNKVYGYKKKKNTVTDTNLEIMPVAASNKSYIKRMIIYGHGT